VIAILAGGFFGVRWWLARRAAETAAQPPAAAPPAAAAPTADQPPAITLPPMDQMDPFLRQLLGVLSTRPELARWLATDDITRRLVLIVDQVARGGSPTAELKSVAPAGAFTVVTRDGRRTVDPQSYRRYDNLAATADSMDAQAVVRAYTTIKPRLADAYRQTGRTDGDFDQVLQAAIGKLLQTPVPSAPPEVVQGRGLNYVYADPALEALEPAQKQLLRMVPRNQQIVLDNLREIDDALKGMGGD
jgi:hypothetical protein